MNLKGVAVRLMEVRLCTMGAFPMNELRRSAEAPLTRAMCWVLLEVANAILLVKSNVDLATNTVRSVSAVSCDAGLGAQVLVPGQGNFGQGLHWMRHV